MFPYTNRVGDGKLGRSQGGFRKKIPREEISGYLAIYFTKLSRMF